MRKFDVVMYAILVSKNYSDYQLPRKPLVLHSNYSLINWFQLNFTDSDLHRTICAFYLHRPHYVPCYVVIAVNMTAYKIKIIRKYVKKESEIQLHVYSNNKDCFMVRWKIRDINL